MAASIRAAACAAATRSVAGGTARLNDRRRVMNGGLWCNSPQLLPTSHQRPRRDERLSVQTLDEMRDRCLLTHEQHAEIGAWVSQARTPEAIMAMPEGLWRTLELASVLMDVDADLRREPLLSDGL